MLTEERHAFIISQLEKKNILTVQELVEQLNHSESTIRRDLTMLEDQNKLVRIHGGATKKRQAVDEPTMDEKTVKYSQEKEKISQLAASLIEDFELIFLDAGTTTYAMIPYLEGKKITVITNGVPHAALLTDYHIDTVLVGGKIKQRTKAVIGSMAERQLDVFNFTKAYLGMNGISTAQGYTTPDIEEAAIKRKAVSQSNQSYVLADLSKLGEVSFVKVADIEDCTVITTKLPEGQEELKDYTRVMEA